MIRDLLLLGSLLSVEACQTPPETLRSHTVRILDEADQPTAARVRFSSLEGVYYAPEGHSADFPVTNANVPESIEKDIMMDYGRRFAYVGGEFEIVLPEKVRIEVLKGYLYKIFDDTLEWSGKDGPLEIRLEKFVDLPEDNWYSGDVHVHFINPESALLEMKAEDLNVCNVLISDFTVDHDRFRGEIEPTSNSEYILYYGQEYREDRLGHVNLLNLKDKLIEPSKDPRVHQYPLNMSASEEVHKDGGHISWAHFAAWPGLEGPLALVLKKVDAVELLCTIDPFHPPIFVSDVVPEVRMNSGLKLWYRLLNCGLNIPATAGTDKMNNQVSVGANRVFAQVDGEFNYDNWIKAINAGRTFISNSPILSFTVEGQGPGTILDVEPGEEYVISAEVWSQMPIDRLEIVANGELVAEKSIARGNNHAELEIRFKPEKSVWLAARAYQFTQADTRKGLSLSQRRDAGGGPTLLNRYYGTLRPETTFSHSSPVYLLVEGKPIQSTKDASYFVGYLENSIRWLDESGSFPDQTSKQEVLEAFEEGKKVFQGLASGK